ncbi:uncharacterized protein YbjT (DUF2867 family) [Sinobaca qinghaiensis]|uniref:Uncharacterized protein YbjT (DUF2867 family) n=1 Tax=Sinobaca qinghaiensis TaxID=342944 RepID=A0A419V3X9_9BACL|nr:SDR family oxidoreductase [Sinobaca qinghaiensis]RKD73228.1 uncharacterized protein YbjT (DUF2867 family) [Sinobaca qinghaiensis]
MRTLVTGFTGKVGYEVAKKLKAENVYHVCAVRDPEKAEAAFGDEYDFVKLDFSDPGTFDEALEQVDRIFLMYPPGGNFPFKKFLEQAKKSGIVHIAYLSLKDAQYIPFLHHYKMEKLIKKSAIPYTFVRAGYFMQNLNDFLREEIKEKQRIFVPAGKGKTSFVDTRDLAEISALALVHSERHKNKSYAVTGAEALDFYEVAEIMTNILGVNIEYTEPSVKEFKAYMEKRGENKAFINVTAGIHISTKLGLAKGVTHDYQKITGGEPTNIRTYIEDFKEYWEG